MYGILTKNGSTALLLIASLLLSLTFPVQSLHASPRLPVTVFSQEPTTFPGYALQYTSFDGTTFNLTAYDGKFIRYALPDTWTQPGTLTPARLRQLIDLTDIVYAQLAEITAGEPQGDGLLTIAVIPNAHMGGQAGAAGRNSKGVELSDNELGSVMQNLTEDLLSPLVVHELSHNFEIWGSYLSLSYPDSGHAWTSFLIPFLQYYSRGGDLQSDADALIQKSLIEYTHTWDASGATWTQCVRNGNTCPNIQANSAWAGLLLRFTKLHGIEALKRSFRYLRDYAATHPVTGSNPTSPQTPEAKNDLLVEALADGAQQNILCEIDAWHWFTTPEARTRINQKFSSPNLFCSDLDEDGFSPLTGDTNDTNAQIKPTAIETINNLDDDCDGLIDDIAINEQSDFPATSQGAPTITFPSKVRGQATSLDVDTIIINHTDPLPRRLRINVQSPNSFVGFIQLQPVDLMGRTQSFAVAGGGARVLTLPRPGLWALSIQNLITSTSEYTVTLEDAGPQMDNVHLSTSPGAAPNTIQITASTTSLPLSGPNALRFWLGPTGFTTPISLQPEIIVTLPVPPGTGPFSLRAQLLTDTNPFAKATTALWIDRATYKPIEQPSDIAITADTTLASETAAGAKTTFGFTITNNGPGPAQAIDASLTLPSGLTTVSTATTSGVSQVTANTFRLALSQLGTTESVSFSITATNLTANGRLTTTATITTATTDPVPANNIATITGTFTAPQPTPTIEALPTRRPVGAPRSILALDSLARATVTFPATSIANQQGQADQNGAWPITLAGFQVRVGPLFAPMIAVTKIPFSNPTQYTIDFLVPANAPIGNTIPVIIEYLPTTLWTTSVPVAQTDPALWAADGTATGPLLVLDADLFTTNISASPFPANNSQRLIIFASGANKLLETNNLVLRARCPSGLEVILARDYASTLPSMPGLLQLVFRIPSQLSGCGMAQISIDGSENNQVFLPIQ